MWPTQRTRRRCSKAGVNQKPGATHGFDDLSSCYDRGTVLMASAGLTGDHPGWVMKPERRTPRYTSCWGKWRCLGRSHASRALSTLHGHLNLARNMKCFDGEVKVCRKFTLHGHKLTSRSFTCNHFPSQKPNCCKTKPTITPKSKGDTARTMEFFTFAGVKYGVVKQLP